MASALQPITTASFMNGHGKARNGRLLSLSETSSVDEPQSKRPRRMKVTLHTHAEVVEDEMAGSQADSTKFGIGSPMNTAAVPVGDAENLSQGSFRKDDRVCLRGFDARPQLNGQAGKILGFHAATSRWMVSFDEGSNKLVSSAHLQPETVQIASRTSVENTDVAPQELLMAQLLSSRLQALRRVDVVSGRTCAQVGQVRSEVRQSCDIQQRKLLLYCELSKPTDHQNQLARNNIRKELREVAEAVLSSMQRLLETSVEPTAALRAAEAEQLANIDSMMNTLSVFRTETAALFEEYSEKVGVDRQATQNTVLSLANGIEPVNKFMQCFAQEVQHERAEANSLHQEQLQHLEKEEADHVAANGDPDQNPVFAQVRDDLAAVRRLLEEQASNNASHTSLMQSWESMWNLMPSKKLVVEADQPKRGLWGRFWG